MKTFFTSDPHFGHSNIIKYCNRPFQSSKEMDDALIANWNSKVGVQDKVWILGDVFFCDQSRAKEILSCLNGQKHLILGNHDKLIRNQKPVQDMFTAIYPELHQENIDGVTVVMCHYPMLTWNRAHRGSYMLHGHCHNTIPFDKRWRRLDVGVDAHDYAPIEWTQINRLLSKCDAGDVRDY